MAYIPPRGVATGGISGQGPQGVSTVRGGGAVVPPRKVKVAPKTVPGAPAGPNKAALIAKYLAGLRSGAGTGGGGIPDMSGGIPGAPGFGLYTGNTVPDYGAQVPNSEFPGFKQGAASSVDPRAYARIAGQAYTPMLDELRRQQQGYQAGQAAGNAQIESAYGTASDLATQSRDRILQSGANTAAANNTANANLVNSAGNDPIAAAAATQANAANQNLSGALSSIDAQGAGDSAAAAQRQKAASELDYRNSVSDKSNALGLQIGSTAAQQTQDKQKALMDALNFNDQMKTSGLNRSVTAQSARLASMLAGGEITAQQLQNAQARGQLTKAQVDSAMGKTQFNNTVMQDNFNNMITKVNSVAQLKTLAKTAKNQGLDVTKLPYASAASVDTTSYQNAEEMLIKPNIGADGASLVDPRKLYDQTFRALNQRDPTTPKAVKAALARQLVQGTVNTYNTKNNTDWVWGGNTFNQKPKK